jgi:hypothetical protein
MAERVRTAKRRDWALCRLDRTVAYRLTFDRTAYRWEVAPMTLGTGDASGPEDPSGARDDGPHAIDRPAGSAEADHR